MTFSFVMTGSSGANSSTVSAWQVGADSLNFVQFSSRSSCHSSRVESSRNGTEACHCSTGG